MEEIFHELYSLYILKAYHTEMRERYKSPDRPLPSFPSFQHSPPSENSFKVGIIGAGVSGLYAAMILQSLGIEYEILEAQQYHIGGRLLTHHFSEGGPNDYYDIGAMRFPNTLPMWRTFDLFYRLKFTGKYIHDKATFKELDRSTRDKTREDARDIYDNLAPTVTFEGASSPPDVIQYRIETPEDINRFNGISIRRKDIRPSVNQFQLGVPELYHSKGAQFWLDAKLGYFKEALKDNFEKGMQVLLNYDFSSTRHFMRNTHPELTQQFDEYMKEHYPNDPSYLGEQAYPDEVINWIETFSSGTSMYDSALTETVMEELDFNYAPEVSWKAIQGGAYRIAQTMAKQLRETKQPKGKIVQNARVVKISPQAGPPAENERKEPMLVQVEGEATPRKYDYVLSTVALSALRVIDLDDCKLSWQLRESLRSLQYGASVKIAIRFTHRWWEVKGHKGGVSKTDGLSRMIVYPSYGIDTNDATMLVSYSWSQDALRLGTFVKGNGSLAEQRLVDLILRDLSKVHACDHVTYEDLKSWLLDHHAYNWYDNEFTVGAFAFFGPAQFRKMYEEVTQPAGRMQLHFAGEATSTNHAWVVGALDSSVRALTQIFYQEGREDLVEKLKNEWGLVTEMSLDMAKLQLALNQDAGETYGRVSGNN